MEMMALPTPGLDSRKWLRVSVKTEVTMPVTSGLPSLVLVWPSNWGSGILTEMTAVMPSRTSSPERFWSFSLMVPALRPYSLSRRVSTLRKPVTWVPPSWVLMLLANASTDSE
ncbi:hypothetical protein D3C87_1575420 [compost metagenome]